MQWKVYNDALCFLLTFALFYAREIKIILLSSRKYGQKENLFILFLHKLLLKSKNTKSNLKFY